MNPARNKRGFSPVFIIIVITIVGGALAALYLNSPGNFIQKSLQSTPSPSQTTNNSSSDETAYTDEGSANWKTYTNNAFKWEIKYPPELVAFDSKLQDDTSIFIDTPQIAADFNKSETWEGPMKIYITSGQNPVTPSDQAPPYLTPAKKIISNDIEWNKFEPTENQEYCDAGSCAKLVPSTYTIKNGNIYILRFQPEYEKYEDQILSTFKFLE